MQAVILAGGMATRLGDLTKQKPKSLIEIAGKPFLQYQLEFLKRTGICDVVLCIGHLGEQIQERFGNGADLGVRIQYSVEDRPLGTAGAIKKATFLLEDIFFTIYGDSYFYLNLDTIYQYFLRRKNIGLMTVFRNYNLYDRSNTAISGGMVTKYDKANTTSEMIYIDYGLNLFRKTVLQLIPQDSIYSLEKVFSRLIVMKELLALEVEDRFYEIGSINGLKEFSSYIATVK